MGSRSKQRPRRKGKKVARKEDFTITQLAVEQLEFGDAATLAAGTSTLTRSGDNLVAAALPLTAPATVNALYQSGTQIAIVGVPATLYLTMGNLAGDWAAYNGQHTMPLAGGLTYLREGTTTLTSHLTVAYLLSRWWVVLSTVTNCQAFWRAASSAMPTDPVGAGPYTIFIQGPCTACTDPATCSDLASVTVSLSATP